jgi:aspartate racemase
MMADLVGHGVAARRSELSAEKRALLEKRLRGATKGAGKRTGIPRRADRTTAPLSFAQQQLWFLDQLTPNSALYNLCAAVRVRGRLERDALEQALGAVVARHESLRTRFVAVEGSPEQIIDEPKPVKLPVIDLTALPAESREGEAQRRLGEEARRPFDLARDLMLRATLLKLGSAEHILGVTVHHIAADGWSLGVFFRELAASYEGFSAGREASLPELPIQYADFAAWQRGWLRGQVYERQLEFWKQRLAGAPAILELPADHPRPAVESFCGDCETLALPGELTERLKSLARQEGVTLFMLLLAAFQVLLYRYTRQADIVVGTPVAGRNQMETEGLIGLFINTLVLRTSLSGEPVFRQLLDRVRQTALDALANQDLPFEKLVEELRLERSLGRNPLFQVMFVLQSAPAWTTGMTGLTLTPMDVNTGTAKFDLTLALEEREPGLRAALEYRTDLFERSAIRRMLGHFQTLLESIVTDPAQPISLLKLLPDPERRQLLAEWNNTRTNYPRGKTIPQLFEEQVEQRPEAAAVVFEGRQLTYRELNERANRLAHYLQRLGVGPEVLVAVCLERSLEMIVALLGILKAGGAYVSLDPTYPKERLAFMLEDTRAPVLLTQEKLRPLLPDLSSRTYQHSALNSQPSTLNLVCLEKGWEGIARESLAAPVGPGSAGAENLAYVSYTSGSTGRPKGVCVTHQGVVRLVRETNYARFGPDEVWLQLAPISFDASTLEIWGALLNGGRLIVAAPTTPSLAELGQFIQQHRITTLWLTAGLFHQMVEENLDSLRGIRQLLSGGDVLSVPHVGAALERLSGCHLINGYGPTENTTFTCCYRITHPSSDERSIPIGRPIANTQVYVLDEHLQPVPIGVPGELCIGGDGLARGYLNRPELTAQRFVPCPFTVAADGTPAATDARLYKTGDLVRWLADGELEFLGRMDLQVKIRGFRVEPGEIEAVLSRHPAVRDCVVAAHADARGDKRLVAYVVAQDSRSRLPGEVPIQESKFIPLEAGQNSNIDPRDGSGTVVAAASLPDELRRFLHEKLPDYMVPSAFAFLDALPLTANGKVDRRALPAPDQSPPGLGKNFVAPRDPVEGQLKGIWEEVLGIQPIGVEDNFFSLGGHSLLAVRLIARIEKTFGKKIPVSAIFQSPTIAQLARTLCAGERSAGGSAVVAIQPQGTRPPLWLVHGVGGGMFWGYTNLSRYLGAEQPVYALKSRGLEGGDEFDRIEDMAAAYVKELRAFQPHGPYFLGGYCFGGDVAYEMARVLEAQRQRVALLALMNCAPPNSSYARIRWTPAFMVRFLANFCSWAAVFAQWTSRQRRDFFRWKTRSLRTKMTRLLARILGRPAEVAMEELVDLSAYPPEQRRVWEIHIRALLDYHPQRYAGHVALFRSRGHPLVCSFDPQYGWGELATGGVTVKIVPGAHESILEEPHVRVVAKELQKLLWQAQI